jgi:hypothetical protein
VKLYRKWLAFSWERPVIAAYVLALLPMWAACFVFTFFLAPRWAVFGVWVYGAATAIERVRPIRRLLRMRRYRSWARKQHRGPERVYATGCACDECSRTRQTDPFHTEIFDEGVRNGTIRLTVTKLDGFTVTETSRHRIIHRSDVCSSCAAGQECEKHACNREAGRSGICFCAKCEPIDLLTSLPRKENQ